MKYQYPTSADRNIEALPASIPPPRRSRGTFCIPVSPRARNATEIHKTNLYLSTAGWKSHARTPRVTAWRVVDRASRRWTPRPSLRRRTRKRVSAAGPRGSPVACCSWAGGRSAACSCAACGLPASPDSGLCSTRWDRFQGVGVCHVRGDKSRNGITSGGEGGRSKEKTTEPGGEIQVFECQATRLRSPRPAPRCSVFWEFRRSRYVPAPHQTSPFFAKRHKTKHGLLGYPILPYSSSLIGGGRRRKCLHERGQPRSSTRQERLGERAIPCTRSKQFGDENQGGETRPSAPWNHRESCRNYL